MKDLLEFIVNHGPIVVAIASLIAAATPTPRDDGWIRTLYKILDLLAVNVGKAKQT